MKLSENCIARKVCVKLNVLKELNNSRMAASSPWRESYWRNVSYVEGLLCAAEVITIFIILLYVSDIMSAMVLQCIKYDPIHCSQVQRGPQIVQIFGKNIHPCPMGTQF